MSEEIKDTDYSEENTDQENTEVEDNDSEEQTKESIREMEAKVAELNAIIKRKEEKVKEMNNNLSKPQKKVAGNGTLDPMEIDRKILEAQGYSEELLDVLETTARNEGTTLLAATKSDYFLFKKEQLEKAEKVQQAQVGASKGSGNRQAPKDFSTPNLSKEDHKKMVQEAMSKVRF